MAGHSDRPATVAPPRPVAAVFGGQGQDRARRAPTSAPRDGRRQLDDEGGARREVVVLPARGAAGVAAGGGPAAGRSARRSGARRGVAAGAVDEVERLVEPDRDVGLDPLDQARAARDSGSDSGRGPEYSAPPSGCQSKGKLRLRSTPWAFRACRRQPVGVQRRHHPELDAARRCAARAGARPASRRSRRRGCSRRPGPSAAHPWSRCEKRDDLPTPDRVADDGPLIRRRGRGPRPGRQQRRGQRGERRQAAPG